jgi:hypothetical protein
MREIRWTAIMATMIRPDTAVSGPSAVGLSRAFDVATVSRVLLVADRRESPSGLRSAPLRRYRLARVRLDGRDLRQREAGAERSPK